MTEVLFCLRIDAATKAGGDLAQARAYRDALETAGMRVAFLHDLTVAQRRAQRWDVVHIFNVSRVYEHLHDLQGVAFDRLYLSPIVQPGYQWSQSTFWKSWLRGVIRGRLVPYVDRARLQAFFGRLSLVVFLSEDERRYFKSHWRLPPACREMVVANGVDDIRVPTPRGLRPIDHLIAGRVERSKNVLRVVRLCGTAFPKRTTVVVGALNWHHPWYVLRFLMALRRYPSVSYLGPVPRDVLAALYAASKRLVNWSQLEVSPLVDLEALAQGCAVLGTTRSFTHLHEGNPSFIRVDPDDTRSLRAALETAASTHGPRSDVRLWTDTLQPYVAVVQQDLSMPGRKDPREVDTRETPTRRASQEG